MFAYVLGVAVLNITMFCNGTTALTNGNPSLCPFLHRDFLKSIARERSIVADASQYPSQLAASRVLEARPL